MRSEGKSCVRATGSGWCSEGARRDADQWRARAQRSDRAGCVCKDGTGWLQERRVEHGEWSRLGSDAKADGDAGREYGSNV